MPNHFPWYKEPWIECYVCGFEYPLSQAVINHKTHRYVDLKCDDQLSHGDILEYWDMPREVIQISPQPVPDQGAPSEGEEGAGEGGAGEGGAG